jgi:hypothetical protein
MTDRVVFQYHSIARAQALALEKKEKKGGAMVFQGEEGLLLNVVQSSELLLGFGWKKKKRGGGQ